MSLTSSPKGGCDNPQTFFASVLKKRTQWVKLLRVPLSSPFSLILVKIKSNLPPPPGEG